MIAKKWTKNCAAACKVVAFFANLNPPLFFNIFAVLVFVLATGGRRQREHQKSRRFNGQNGTLTLYISQSFLFNHYMKLIFLYTFYGGRKQTTLSLRTWVKCTYIWHFKQVEINGTKFKNSAFILELTMTLLMPKVALLLIIRPVSNVVLLPC